MPNGYPYLLRSSEPGCLRCEEPVAHHDRERVYPEDGPPGSYHYEYYCADGSEYRSPVYDRDE